MKVINNSKEFTEYQFLKVLKQILSALNYCHSKKIIHRDVKPENILFTRNSVNSQIKLIDFGISVRTQDDLYKGNPGGTIYYSAPEIYTGEHTFKSDIWSLGVIVFQIITGNLPFYCYNHVQGEIIDQILSKDLKFEEDEWKYTSDEFREVVRKMLIRNPDNRPSCDELLSMSLFQKEYTPPLNELKRTISDLKKIKAQTSFKQAILNFISVNIAHLHIPEDAIKIYNKLDKDKDGVISRDEISELFTSLYPKLESIEEEVTKFMDLIDADNSGAIDYSEYVVALMCARPFLNQEEFIKVFDLLDRDKDGNISKFEFRTALVGCGISDEEWEEFAKTSQLMKKDNVTLSEFLRIFRKCLLQE